MYAEGKPVAVHMRHRAAAAAAGSTRTCVMRAPAMQTMNKLRGPGHDGSYSRECCTCMCRQ